jgi:curli production assembly/transport component CsgG
MAKLIQLVCMASIFLTLNSCGTYFNQPLDQAPARIGEYSKSTNLLTDLPRAAEPVEVAVYNFSDQTGQYKAIENGSTFSTAVTQGATTILIKALEDSKWFRPIERENLNNLSTERNIIRNTKQEYIKNLNPNEPPLPPLLYAGLLLEGGIISYDTNIVTGGIGARFFGVGGSAKYRQDRITIYLRAVSTSNGEVLKTIYVSKTILSQSLDGSFFRFVKFQRLLEAETGITQNEPLQMAVQDAIEKAVHDLILEGIIDKYWNSVEGPEADQALVDQYLKEKNEVESIDLYNRVYKQRDKKNVLEISGGLSLIDADYSTKNASYMARLGYRRILSPYISLGLSGSYLELDSGEQFSKTYFETNFNTQFNILPKDDFSPYLYAGGGLIRESNNSSLGKTFYKLQYGGGLNIYLNQSLGLKIFAEHNIVLSDELDGLKNGKRDDFYFNFGVGLDYFFNLGKTNKSPVEETTETVN